MKRAGLTVIAACAMLLWVGAAQAENKPTLVCEQSKLKANGVLEACLATNRGNVLAGKADESAVCQANFTKALAKADKAATKAKTACRYVDNGDGTVSDLDTALMWEQETGTVGTILTNPPVTDVNNNFSWCTGTYPNCANPSKPPDGTAFTLFLATLNNGASTDGGVSTPITGCYANHCDWRLPSIVELQGIVDTDVSVCKTGSPCIDPTFGPTQSNAYWSATTGAVGAWLVDFSNGDVGDGIETVGVPVRAVRSGL